MNRREALAAGAATMAALALPTGAIKPCTDQGARVFWIAICRMLGTQGSTLPTTHVYCEAQAAKGRKIVTVLHNVHDIPLVAVEWPCESMDQACQRMEKMLADDDLLNIKTLGVLGPGESFDVAEYAAGQVAADRFEKRLNRLENQNRSYKVI